MNSPWFKSQERIDALWREARLWFGTPFSPNGNMPGPAGGVSCQFLSAGLYRGCGFGTFEPPVAAMTRARFATDSQVEAYMATLPQFARLELPASMLAGDQLGFLIGRAIHHLGTALSATHFIHAIDGCGVVKVPINDATFRSRLAAIWRPIEL